MLGQVRRKQPRRILIRSPKRSVRSSLGSLECYWKRMSSLDGSDIINNNGSNGPEVVEILASDKAFQTKNHLGTSTSAMPGSMRRTCGSTEAK
jgi:hypothetical protein